MLLPSTDLLWAVFVGCGANLSSPSKGRLYHELYFANDAKLAAAEFGVNILGGIPDPLFILSLMCDPQARVALT